MLHESVVPTRGLKIDAVVADTQAIRSLMGWQLRAVMRFVLCNANIAIKPAAAATILFGCSVNDSAGADFTEQYRANSFVSWTARAYGGFAGGDVAAICVHRGSTIE